MSASKFTPEVRGALLERIAAGVSLRDGCRVVGVRENTAKSWLQRGRRETVGAYHEFAVAVEQAREAARALPVPMDADELARVVSEQARKGSVAAMKLRFEMLRAAAAREDAPAGAPDLLDELEERRAQR